MDSSSQVAYAEELEASLGALHLCHSACQAVSAAHRAIEAATLNGEVGALAEARDQMSAARAQAQAAAAASVAAGVEAARHRELVACRQTGDTSDAVAHDGGAVELEAYEEDGREFFRPKGTGERLEKEQANRYAAAAARLAARAAPRLNVYDEHEEV